MKSKLLFLISIYIIIQSIMPANGMTTIKCHLYGYDGKPMPLAHIHLINKLSREPAIPIEAGADGSFTLSIDKPGFYDIQFTGVNHNSHSITFLTLDKDETLSMNVQLSPNNIDGEIKNVTVIGNFNDYDFESGISMQKQSDGTYSAEIEKKSDSLIYQILGPFTLPMLRSVNGTNQDFYVYDGGGDYRSVIVSKDSKVKITFNPALYMIPASKAKVTSKDESISHYLETSSKIRELFYESQAAMRKSAEKATNKVESSAKLLSDISEMNNLLKSTGNYIDKETDPRTRTMALIEYLQNLNYAIYYLSPKDIDPKYLKSLIKEVSPLSSIWGIYGSLALTLYKALPEKEIMPYLEQMTTKNEYVKFGDYINNQITGIKWLREFEDKGKVNVDFKKFKDSDQILLYSAKAAKSKKNDKGVKYFYGMLKKEFPDSKVTSKADMEFKEDRNIQVGKKILNFKYAAFDNPGEFITPQTFKGKYVLIDLWATWCGPCIGELPNMHKIYEKYHPKNFEIYSISIDPKSENVTNFRNKKFKMPWVHSFAEGAWESQVCKDFECNAIPRPVLVGPDGTILAIEGDLRGEKLEKTLEKYLQ